MATFLLLVQSNPTSGRDREYNDWYTNTHLPEVLAVAGFSAAQRFKVMGEAVAGEPQHEYVAIYELDTDDPEGAVAALGAAAEGGEVQMSDALDQAGVVATLIEPITGRVVSRV